MRPRTRRPRPPVVSRLNAWRFPAAAIAALAFTLASGYGALDEWHQAFVPGRYPTMTDAALNAFGAGLVAGLWWLLASRSSAIAAPRTEPEPLERT